jgi:GR25 family glycosyltransferase involved in LPS biosynthesis
MKSFCISLEKNKHHWRNILDMIRNAGFEDVEIFPGINGNEIGKMDNGEPVSENTQNLVDSLGGLSNLLTLWARYSLKTNKKRKYDAQLSSWGAVGCYLSHVLIWNMMIEDDLPYCAIFEDDVKFVDNFKEEFQKRLEFIPDDADGIFLGVSDNFLGKRYNEYFDRIEGVFFGLHAYILTNAGAKKLLKNVFPIEVQIDSNMSFSAVLEGIKLYDAPGLTRQGLHISSVQDTCLMCNLNEQRFGILMVIYFLMIFALIFIIFIRSRNGQA